MSSGHSPLLYYTSSWNSICPMQSGIFCYKYFFQKQYLPCIPIKKVENLTASFDSFPCFTSEALNLTGLHTSARTSFAKEHQACWPPVGSFYWSPITSNKGQIPPAIFQSTPYPILRNVFAQAIPLPYSPPFLRFQILLFLQGYQIATSPIRFPLVS